MSKAAGRAALERLISTYRAGGYSTTTSEADVRENLLVPLLRDVLGWNTSDITEFNRERFARGSGFADAVLLDGPRAILYLEAKRLGKISSVSELRRRSAFYSKEEEQALRYARRSTNMREGERWTILSNFEKIRVFEATREDRVMEFETAEELLERFDDLWLLAKPELRAGNLKRWYTQRKKPEVDEEFRETLNEWRRQVAQDLFDRNAARFGPSGPLTLGDLQCAVQRLLDRLILVQFAADVDALGDEDPLRDLLDRTAPAVSPRALVQPQPLRNALFDTFRRFDEFYNTSLFAAGHVVESLDVSESLLRKLLESIASQSFRRFDADILGTTYETYLAHQLVLRQGRVELDLKPEVRRAGGVYYTPREVVNAAVEYALRPAVQGAKTPAEVDAIKIIDPACGSGSFLIRAFDVLAEWYEVENDRRRAEREAAATLEALGDPPIEDFGRRILERNIYGIDLDPEAAELAAVNLIMQAMRRGHTGLHLGRLPLIFGQNIKIGNSVVPGHSAARALSDSSPDDVRNVKTARSALKDVTDPETERLATESAAKALTVTAKPHLDAFVATHPELASRAPFLWELEFPEVFDPDRPKGERGFAVVLGNPPWIGFHGDVVDRPYLEATYATAVGRFDMYVPFVELALEILRTGGTLALVTPSNYFLRDYGVELRRRLREKETVDILVDFGSRQLFRGATNYPAITVVKHEQPPADHELVYLRDEYEVTNGQRHRQAALEDEGWVFLTQGETALLQHISGLDRVQELDAICRLDAMRSGLAKGIVTGQNDVFLLDDGLVTGSAIEKALLRPCLKGEDVERWAARPAKRYLVYPYRGDALVGEDELKKTPNLYAWLESKKAIPANDGGLAGRDYVEATGKAWYELWNQRVEAVVGVPKVLTPEVNDRPEFALVPADTAFTDSVTSASPSEASGVCREYLVGLLNSRLLALHHARRSVPKANGYLVYSPAFLKRLPIRVADLADAVDKARHDRIVELVQECARLTAVLRSAAADFRVAVGPFAVTHRTLHALLNPHGTGAREYLCRRPGTTIRLGVRRESNGKLVLGGDVRFTGVGYARGGAEWADLLRISVPEPLATFIEYYVPVSGARLARLRTRAAGRNLADRAGDLLVPDMSDRDIAAAVAAHAAALATERDLRRQLSEAESDIDKTVMEVYELTEDMKYTVRSFMFPAEVLRPVS